MNKRSIYISLTILITSLFVFLYDLLYSNLNYKYILADILFIDSMIILVGYLIVLSLNLGGFSSIRYYFEKKKLIKNKQPIPEYSNYINNIKKYKTLDLFIIFIVLFILSYIISFI